MPKTRLGRLGTLRGMIGLCAIAHQRLMQFGRIDRKILCGTFARELNNGRATPPCRGTQRIELYFLGVDYVRPCRFESTHSAEHEWTTKNDLVAACSRYHEQSLSGRRAARIQLALRETRRCLAADPSGSWWNDAKHNVRTSPDIWWSIRHITSAIRECAQSLNTSCFNCGERASMQ